MTPTPNPSPPGGGEIKAAASAIGIEKRFGATIALGGVSFDVMPGEIHALIGENGAGKSTLIRILGGVHRPDAGEIRVDDFPRQFASPRAAIAAGVVTIPQELRLLPALSIAENIALGDPPVRRVFGLLPVVDRARMRDDARAILARLDFSPDPDLRVEHLSFAERQLVAIAKALRRRCRVFILDEPTAALEGREIKRLFAVLARMKEQGTAIVYVSHRLDEVVELADRCTVLRDGRVVAASRRGAFGVADLIHAMTGRAADDAALQQATPGEIVLEDAEPRPDAIRLHAREVVGLAGLLGSGAQGVVRRLFGLALKPSAVRVAGQPRRLDAPVAAISAGVGMVPGERRLGLIMNQSVRDNILLPSLDRLSRGGRLDRAAGDRLASELMEAVDIRPRKLHVRVSALSGGNQQKVILAKWLASRVGVLLLDEPTQGVDVAAKSQIHALLRSFAARGGAVLAYSSDLAELALLCDAVLAVRQGRIAARMDRADGIDEKQLHAAIGGQDG
jgi:ABC-type sugar transport system ATPase subunit